MNNVIQHPNVNRSVQCDRIVRFVFEYNFDWSNVKGTLQVERSDLVASMISEANFTREVFRTTLYAKAASALNECIESAVHPEFIEPLGKLIVLLEPYVIQDD